MAGSITTICIVGFPPEALPRELKNLCRFMNGFEGAHVAFAGGGGAHGVGAVTSLFVKFANAELAVLAMEAVNGIPFDIDNPSASLLKAEWARREMEVRSNSTLPPPLVTNSGAPWGPNRAVARPAAAVAPANEFPAAAPIGSGYNGSGYNSAGPMVARSTAPQTAGGEQLVTLTILGMTEKGLTADHLIGWFQARPGFLGLQVNERIDAMFVKFSSRAAAEQGLLDANVMQFGAEWARRNLDDDPNARNASQAPPQYPAVAPMPMALPTQPPPQQVYGGRGSEPLVTITVLGLNDKPLPKEDMLQWFQQQPGFEKLQVNDRIDGVFVKFASAVAAQQALQESNRMLLGAEWARRNLDDDRSVPAAPAAMPTRGAPYQPAASASVGPAYAVPTGGGYGGGGYGGGGYGGGGWSGGSYGPSGPKRQRTIPSAGELDTITILSIREKGLNMQELERFFQDQAGFVAMQINERIDGLFVKFSDRARAEQGMHEANARNYGAEWARRNLDL